MPPMVQLIVFAVLFLAMMLLIMRGLAGQNTGSFKVVYRTATLSMLLMVIAGLWAGPDASRRLELAVKPRGVFDYPIAEVTMIVTPPAYSGRQSFTERLVLDQEEGDNPSSAPTTIPEGSKILIMVGKTPYPPTLHVGGQKIEFLLTEGGGYAAEFIAYAQLDWEIKQGSYVMGQWPLLLLEDEQPVIDRAELRILKEGGGLFGLSLGVSDDYGLKKVSVAVTIAKDDQKTGYDETILPISHLKQFDGNIFVDLTSSSFAGEQVNLMVKAEDEAGQIGQRMIENIILPEKDFSKPLSRKIIEIRDAIRKKPDERVKMARQIMALGLVPDNGPMETQAPAVYYMALRSAYWRLTTPLKAEDVESAQQILWDLAVLLEDGDAGQFKHDILALLANLKLSLYQKKDLPEIRRQLQEIDKEIILFLRNQTLDEHNRHIDVQALRKVYSKILLNIHNKNIDEVIGLISYLEHGFIFEDKDMLSGQGFMRFQTAHHARKSVTTLEKIQRKMLSASLKNAVKLELASAGKPNDLNLPKLKNMAQWITTQKKLGEDISDLGRQLLKSGIDASWVTVPIGDLVRDSVRSLEGGNMEMASQYQTQIMTLLTSLKKLLDEELRFDPTGQAVSPMGSP